MGPIAPASSHGYKRYILVATYYVTKWAEAFATKTDNATAVARTFISKYNFEVSPYIVRHFN